MNQVSAGNAPPPRPPAPTVEVKRADEVTDGLLSGIEEDKTGSRELESLNDKLRRLERQE